MRIRAALAACSAVLACGAMSSRATAGAAAWRNWGGPNGNFLVDSPRLAEAWPEGGPRKLWSLAVTGGYASIVVADGTAFVLAREGDEEMVLALDAATGDRKWQYRYEAKVPLPERSEEERKQPRDRRNRPDDEYVEDFGFGPNSTPLVLEDRVITIGFMGDMHCLDRAGKLLWKHDLIDEYKSNFLRFGYAASPILHDGKVIVLVGGKDYGVVAFNPADGSTVWHKHDYGASYASPMIASIDGKDVLICHMRDKLLALDPKTGDAWWSVDHVNQNGSNIATPLGCPGNLLFNGTPAQKDKSIMYRLAWQDGKLTGEQAWESTLRLGHQNAVLLEDKLVSTRGRGGGSAVAVSLKDGADAWQDRGIGAANLLAADRKLIALGHDGALRLARLKADGIEVLAQAQLLEDPSWTPPTLVGSILYIRDRKTVMALDLGGGASASAVGS